MYRRVDVFSYLSSQLTKQRFVKKMITVDGMWCLNMIRKQTTNFAIETAGIPTTQESSHVEVRDEDNAHHFLRYLGYC
jgi:hypothetical protein